MISDVLWEAVREIRRYQKDMPHAYGDLQTDIDAVVSSMEKLRYKLDRLPADAAKTPSRANNESKQ